MKYARQVGNVIQEIIDFDPSGRFAQSVAAQFFSVVDTVQVGARLVNGAWVNPDPAPAPQAPTAPAKIISPIEFKLLFTSAERIAIQAARATDPIIDDFYDILDDPRLTEVNLGLKSTQNGVGYLALQGHIAPARVVEILTGVVQ
jgi:hypothetical protein